MSTTPHKGAFNESQRPETYKQNPAYVSEKNSEKIPAGIFAQQTENKYKKRPHVLLRYSNAAAFCKSLY